MFLFALCLGAFVLTSSFAVYCGYLYFRNPKKFWLLTRILIHPVRYIRWRRAKRQTTTPRQEQASAPAGIPEEKQTQPSTTPTTLGRLVQELLTTKPSTPELHVEPLRIEDVSTAIELPMSGETAQEAHVYIPITGDDVLDRTNTFFLSDETAQLEAMEAEEIPEPAAPQETDLERIPQKSEDITVLEPMAETTSPAPTTVSDAVDDLIESLPPSRATAKPGWFDGVVPTRTEIDDAKACVEDASSVLEAAAELAEKKQRLMIQLLAAHSPNQVRQLMARPIARENAGEEILVCANTRNE